MFNCFDFYVTPSLFQDERPIQVTLLSQFYPLTGPQNEKVTLKVKQLSKQTETCLLQMVLVDLYYDKVWRFSIFLSCVVVGESSWRALLKSKRTGNSSFQYVKLMRCSPTSDAGTLC